MQHHWTFVKFTPDGLGKHVSTDAQQTGAGKDTTV